MWTACIMSVHTHTHTQVLLVMINSIDALFLLVFMLFMSVILFSSLMYVSPPHPSILPRHDATTLVQVDG